MNPIPVPDTYNYIGVFLTLACTLDCPYCINRFGALCGDRSPLTGRQWVALLNRLEGRDDLPVTLQGGEPTMHPDFYYIVTHLRQDLPLDLLTNLQFDVKEFMSRIKPERFTRNAPYASIRVSYHPGSMDLEILAQKVLLMQRAGYSIGIWGILHPAQEKRVLAAAEYCRALGIDFRIKEFLGIYEGRLFGTYTYPEACSGQVERKVRCRTSELLVGPDGGVYRCHRDLYEGRLVIGTLADPCFQVAEVFRDCTAFGKCNPCDVKLKTNRHQVFGHTSVRIEFAWHQEDMARGTMRG